VECFYCEFMKHFVVGNETERNCHIGEWHELLISRHKSNMLVIYLPSDEDCT